MSNQYNHHVSPALVQAIDLFSGLDTAVLESLAGKMQLKRFNKKDTVLSRNEMDRGVYFIATGSVRVTSFSSSGKETSYHDKGAGEMFGELSAIDGQPRAADIVVTADASLLYLSHQQFNELVQSSPEVNQRLIKGLIGEVRSLTQRVYEFSALSVRYRIYAEVARIAQRATDAHGAADGPIELHEFPTHAELATRVTTTREAVTREISRLAEMELVVKSDDLLIIPSLARLLAILPDK